MTAGKFGSVIRAIRDNEARVRFLGYHVERYKLFIFTVTAMVAGVAGALYYPQAGIINPAEIAPSRRSIWRFGSPLAGAGGFMAR